MSNLSRSANQTSGSESVSGSLMDARSDRGRQILPKTLDGLFLSVGQYLREGQSSKAEKVLIDTIQKYDHGDDDLANLKRLQAFTLETIGRYKESLETLQPYEDEDMRTRLSKETRVRVTTQLAISYNNLGDHPKAVTLLKETLELAKESELNQLLGPIEIALARVYRKLNECAICRDYAEKSLAYFREKGDWLGISEAYREIALSHHQEGSQEAAGIVTVGTFILRIAAKRPGQLL